MTDFFGPSGQSKQKGKVLWVRLDPEVSDAFKKAAKKHKLTMTKLVGLCIKDTRDKWEK